MFEPKDKSFDKDSLQTPEWIFKWLNDKYHFDVDLAASKEHHFIDEYFTKKDSAFDYQWRNTGRNGFCNPPYSNIDPWITQAIQESTDGFTTVFVIPDFNGENRFYDISKYATTIIHLIGRVSFIRPDNGEEYKGNNRGTGIFEFREKHWDTPPQHLYVKTKDIQKQYE